MSGEHWYHENLLLSILNERADELLARSEKQSEDGAHKLAKLTSFRAMGVVDAINAIRRVKGGSLPPTQQDSPELLMESPPAPIEIRYDRS